MIVKDERKHLPVFKLPNFAGDFKTPNLLIEGIKKLLTSGGSCESRTVMFCTAKTSKV